MHTLSQDLRVFNNSNMDWLYKACSLLLSSKNIKLDQYLNDLVDPKFHFDELAITIVCKMYNIHALVLCKEPYWTTRYLTDYANCLVKFAYFSDGLYKEVIPQVKNTTVFMGLSADKAIAVLDHENVAKDQLCADFDVPHIDGEDEPDAAQSDLNVDQTKPDDMDQDLEGIGLLSGEELPYNNVTPAA